MSSTYSGIHQMKTREVISSAIALLQKREKRMLLAAVLLQFVGNLADILGIALVGAIGSLGVTYVAGLASPSWVISILATIGLESIPLQDTIMIIAGIAGLLFISKSILSLILMKRIFIFLANRQARVSIDLAEKLTRAPFYWLKRQSSDRLVYATTDGTSALFIGVLGNWISIIVDSALLILILLILLLVNPVLAITTVLFFSSFAFIFYKLIQNYSTNLGLIFSNSAIKGRENLATIFMGYREIFSSRKSEFFLDAFRSSRFKNTSSNANAMWLQYIPKATAEIGLVIGASGIVVFQFWQNSASGGLGTILLFLASASRLTPALLRIQGSFIYLKNYSGAASETLALSKELEGLKLLTSLSKNSKIFQKSVPVQIELDRVSFQFSDSKIDVLNRVSMVIKAGSVTALAGPSGSGKTTLADLIIGLYSPSEGQISYRNYGSNEHRSSSDVRISYVPQSPFIIGGTLLENIAVGVEEHLVDQDLLDRVIESSHLTEFVKTLPDGLYANLSGIGSRVSGGEKQRIALARALYLQPELLVIDEGTSALDATSEKSITDFLISLSGKVTVILIAHRLPSIKGADDVYFLDSGAIKGHGSFTELQQDVPEFAEQVKFMELPQTKGTESIKDLD
jgi:ATP-binding cassette subfamily C protein